jgi:heat shock protein HtpX
VTGPWGPRPERDLEKARQRWSRRAESLDSGKGPFGLHPPPGPPPTEEAAETLRRDPAAARRADPLKRTDFFAAKRENERKTFWLCASLILVGGLLGYAIGLAYTLLAIPQTEAEIAKLDWVQLLISPGPIYGAGLMLIFSIVWTMIALTFGDRMVVAMAGGKFVDRDAEPVLYNVAEEMAIASGLPVPRIAVIETPALNAFATGLDPEKAVIGVTRGLLDKLNRAELQGVVGHEMAHVANNDILYATAVGVMVGLIVLISDMLLRSMRFMGSGGRRSGSGKGGGGLAILAIVILVVAAILAPIAAMLVQFAISRQREYLADATSVQFTRNPHGLIGALAKIAGSTEKFDHRNRAIQHLFISNPERSFSETASSLWATHPHPNLRIERLRELG